MNPDPIDDLRNAWLATIAATDRAGAQLHGAGPPGRRLPWQDAVTECWRALSLVYAGVAAARDPAIWASDRDTGSAGEVLAGLRAAQGDADRAAALAARVRTRLSAAEDRLRRTRIVADATAARHLAAAIVRLDLVVTRLAVGTRRIDRSVAALTGAPTAAPDPDPPSTSATGRTTSTSTSTDEIARGCRTASALVRNRRRTHQTTPRRRLRMIKERPW
ncbi:hypothetical protein V6V47_27245 [Micromonospora sp. CPCC 205539]|uniref:hypothetical protein n=1 Tax=Micromonospora sp. CPCC 205539 TaxID=3122408 RepID=UPI002FEF90A4